MADNDISAPARGDSPISNNLHDLLNDPDMIDVCEEEEESVRKSKRLRERTDSSEEERWTEVKGKKPRRNSQTKEDKFEVYISSKDQLPKQFSMARILKENKIGKICQIKYVSPFKVRLQFENEAASKTLFDCESLISKGWRFQKALEISTCYGLIKYVDLDLKEEEIMDNISCPPPAKLLSFKRLNRRNKDEGVSGWCPSETIRLCFDGNYLPAFVRVCDIEVKVLPYIHQVSQCSQCWRLGHTKKMCPEKKAKCPRCGGPHERCDTESFCCVNCGGDHISMSKSCPIYKKERKLREIMAEFRCTYRKALECYVPPECTNPPDCTAQQDLITPDNRDLFPPLSHEPSSSITPPFKQSIRPSYAQSIKTKATIHNEKTQQQHSAKKPSKAPKNKNRSDQDDWIFMSTNNEEEFTPPDNMEQQENQCPPFKELLTRIKEIIFLRQFSMSEKISSVIKLCLEWIILVVVSLTSEWSWMKALFNLIQSQ